MPSKVRSKTKAGASTLKTPIKSATSATPAINDAVGFYLDDFARTLFPLQTNRELIVRGESEIKDHIRKCLNDKHPELSFASQRRVYADKPGGYLRRTIKLDAVAEYYLYDLIYRNKSRFRRPHNPKRAHYGYRFEKGAPIPATQSYKAFKGALSEYSRNFSHSRGMDVATYFNNIYHHDLVSWLLEAGAPQTDVDGFGQLLREITSGRSIDCLPQGLYPAKMIGNDFLRFVDNYHQLKSEQTIRFMDDIYLFSNTEQNILDDFLTIQRLLGDKGLSVNPRKTQINESDRTTIDNEIDRIKQKLLERRRIILVAGYDESGGEILKEVLLKFPITEEEMSYVNEILQKPDIEEDDAELILTIMRGHAGAVEKRLPYIINTYPHLAKNVYSFCANVKDKEVVADMILGHTTARTRISENQLFWFCTALADQLMNTSKASALISELFNHPSATPITKAKILEIDDARFGLTELRNEFLGNGQSDWLAWSSAVGSRSLKPLSRNHKLKYFAKASPMNHLVATIMLKS